MGCYSALFAYLVPARRPLLDVEGCSLIRQVLRTRAHLLLARSRRPRAPKRASVCLSERASDVSQSPPNLKPTPMPRDKEATPPNQTTTQTLTTQGCQMSTMTLVDCWRKWDVCNAIARGTDGNGKFSPVFLRSSRLLRVRGSVARV